jgi:NADPH:quinone reductase
VKAVVVSHPGGPEVLDLREVPDPPIGPDDVRVAVRATALNRADLLQRLGRYPAPPDAPADIPGLEFAGEVEALGVRAAGLELGDRVMGLLGGGGYAGKVALDARMCVRIPPGLSWEEAASIPEAFMTAFDALFERGRLVAGESVLLHAAASGVGTAAAQIARASGARAIGLARSPAKRRRLEELGLVGVLDPATPGLADAIRHAAGGSVDLVVDLVGAATWPLDLEVLRTGGRLVLVGTMSGSRVDADLSLLMRKRLTVVGTVLRSRPLDEKIALTRNFERDVLPLFADGRLRPIVDRVFPLESAAAAHVWMESNANFGKIVLRVP